MKKINKIIPIKNNYSLSFGWLALMYLFDTIP